MTLYHSTSRHAADAILRSGFVDCSGDYMIGQVTSGTWFSDRPLGLQEGCKGEITLQIDLPLTEKEIVFYEWREAGKRYREWQLPAVLINRLATVTEYIAPVEDEFDRTWERRAEERLAHLLKTEPNDW